VNTPITTTINFTATANWVFATRLFWS